MSPDIELVPDDRGGVTVMRDGHPQSHVQLDDPTLLAFEYVQHLALVVDTMTPHPPAPLAVTHVGGAGLTLPRYLAHTRPGSPQIVLEPDVALTDLVRRELPLPRGHRIRVRATTGEDGVGALAPGSASAILVDAYADGRVPAGLVEPAWLGAAARVLRTDGVLAMNLADEPGLHWVRRVVATLTALPAPAGEGCGASAFAAYALIATHDVLKGRRFGNTVLVAGRAGLDVDELRRHAARSPFPTGVKGDVDVRRMARGANPFRDGEGEESPIPPDLGRWRVR